ncbi:MAG: hypothetical protein KA436_08980 [Oligoflexales bacterium]|nr:hypothetical protein [Oligoflexales bacterium]
MSQSNSYTRNRIFNLTILLIFSFTLSEFFTASSRSLLEKKSERLELDWGQHKARFFGFFRSGKPDHHPGSPPGDGVQAPERFSYAESAERARDEGLVYAQQALSSLSSNYLMEAGIERKAALAEGVLLGKTLVRSAYLFHTEYFQDSGVRVYFETSLLPIWQKIPILSKETPFSNDTPRFSGLIIRSNRAVSPHAVYRVIDEVGQPLLELGDLDPAAFQKNTMGRWFVEASREELSRAVGSKTVSLEAGVTEEGAFVVTRAAWQEALQDSGAIVRRAKIVILQPPPEG